MGWLLKHEKGSLKKLVLNAINDGLLDELEYVDHQDYNKMSEKLHSIILDFLSFLEEVLLDNLEEITLNEQEKRKLVPTLEKLDLHMFDAHTVWRSLADVKAQLSNDKQLANAITSLPPKKRDAKRILFEQLLENWDPDTKEGIH